MIDLEPIKKDYQDNVEVLIRWEDRSGPNRVAIQQQKILLKNYKSLFEELEQLRVISKNLRDQFVDLTYSGSSNEADAAAIERFDEYWGEED